jgi:hypothetical protein
VEQVPFFSLGVNKFDVVWRRAGAGCWVRTALDLRRVRRGLDRALGVQRRSEINEPLRSQEAKTQK